MADEKEKRIESFRKRKRSCSFEDRAKKKKTRKRLANRYYTTWDRFKDKTVFNFIVQFPRPVDGHAAEYDFAARLPYMLVS